MSKKIKTHESNFCHDDSLSQCICSVKEDLPLRPVAERLSSILSESFSALVLVEQTFLKDSSRQTNEPVIPYCHLKLLIAALDQAQGLLGAIWGGIEMQEEDAA